MYIAQDIFVIPNLREAKFVTLILSNCDTTHYINTNTFHGTFRFSHVPTDVDRMAVLGLEDRRYRRHACL